jgi:hypothetical protein
MNHDPVFCVICTFAPIKHYVMKKNIYFLSLLISGMFLFHACSSNDLEKDATDIANAMCRNIDVMNKLRVADPADSSLIDMLQASAKQAQIEMTVLYSEFKEKYKKQLNDEQFNKDFSRYLRRHMLDCPHLSKEDRAQFEKELEKE